MTDRVLNNAEVLVAVREALKFDTRSANAVVSVMKPVNLQADRAANGWVGLYADRVEYTPRSVGAGLRNWNYTPTFRMIVQHSDMNSSEAAFSKLETLVKTLLDVIMDNRALAGRVDTMNGVTVQYDFNEAAASTMYFVAALVTLRFVGTSN